MKLNCWEHKKCGREPGGSKVKELGPCPVYNEKRLNGVHGGKNGGRACWVIESTLCGGVVQGKAHNKYDMCKNCTFYNLVREEEYPNFTLTSTLMAMMSEPEKK